MHPPQVGRLMMTSTAPDLQGAVRVLLASIGEDVTRPGLQDTPRRVVESLRELTDGYERDIGAILATQFDDRCDEMVVVRGIKFASLCEHHMLPFTGIATVGYLPADKVVGLSKIPRLVIAFAHRLQVQERMTQEIADALNEHLRPLGVGVLIRAHHTCMGIRGAMQDGGEMVTSAMLGQFREEPETRAEFLALANGGR